MTEGTAQVTGLALSQLRGITPRWETRMSEHETPIGFFDVSARAFPIELTFVLHETGKVVHNMIVSGPGVLPVPPLKTIHRAPIGLFMKCADEPTGTYTPPTAD